jgi:hypothetical protein
MMIQERFQRGKGARAHLVDACVLGKTEEDRSGRISPENVGDVEDEFVASVASRLDSFNGDDADDVAKLHDALA